VITVDTDSFFAIVVVAAVASVMVAAVPKKYAPPVVVLELMLGIVIGPEILNLAHTDDFVDFFSNLGLGMLFFFAGYEIDFERIKGKPMKLGALGWLLSVALAYGIGGALAAAGIILSFLYTGSAMATKSSPRCLWLSSRLRRCGSASAPKPSAPTAPDRSQAGSRWSSGWGTARIFMFACRTARSWSPKTRARPPPCRVPRPISGSMPKPRISSMAKAAPITRAEEGRMSEISVTSAPVAAKKRGHGGASIGPDWDSSISWGSTPSGRRSAALRATEIRGPPWSTSRRRRRRGRSPAVRCGSCSTRFASGGPGRRG